MQSKFLLLTAILSGQWALEANKLEELLPTVESIRNRQGLGELEMGEQSENEGKFQIAQFVKTPKVDLTQLGVDHQLAHGSEATTFNLGWFTDLDEVAPGSIAVIPLQGLVTKGYSCFGGSMGRAQMVLDAAAHRNVAGILIDCDTYGGQANGLNTLYDAIVTAKTEYKTPVILLINDGSCYSAGYHTASACTEVWASHTTCMVGSIGALQGLMLSPPDDEKPKDGRPKQMVVYATKSTRKNGNYRDAQKGDFSGIVSELDFLNDDFHQHVLDGRGAKLKGRAAELDGSTFNATEGLEYGLIDRIGTYPQALNRLLELAEQPTHDLGTGAELVPNQFDFTNTPTPNKPTEMAKFAVLCAALGFTSLEQKDGFSSFSEEQLTTLNAALEAGQGNATKLAEMTTQLAGVNTELGQVKATVTAKDTEISGLKARLNERPAIDPVLDPAKAAQEAPAPEQPAKEMTAWERLDADMMQEAANQRKKYGYDE